MNQPNPSVCGKHFALGTTALSMTTLRITTLSITGQIYHSAQHFLL
jgi:hypothetical protein